MKIATLCLSIELNRNNYYKCLGVDFYFTDSVAGDLGILETAKVIAAP